MFKNFVGLITISYTFIGGKFHFLSKRNYSTNRRNVLQNKNDWKQIKS